MSVKLKLNPAFERKMKELAKPRNVSFDELMPPSFMRSNTRFQTLQQMVDESGFATDDTETIRSLLKSDHWSQYVDRHTRFKSWDDMLATAAAANMRKHLGT